LTLVTMAALPTLIPAMDVVAFHQPAVVGTASMMATLAWYMASTSAIASIPAIVEVATQGVEELVEEVVFGSKQVVRCVSIGVVIIAAIAVVSLGVRLLRFLHAGVTAFTATTVDRIVDPFRRRYGGRLRGGAKPAARPSVTDVFGSSAATVRTGQIEPDRLTEGDRFSFIYFRGSRSGRRRTVKLLDKCPDQGSVRLTCREEGDDCPENDNIRHYWPRHSADTQYLSPEEEEPREFYSPDNGGYKLTDERLKLMRAAGRAPGDPPDTYSRASTYIEPLRVRVPSAKGGEKAFDPIRNVWMEQNDFPEEEVKLRRAAGDGNLPLALQSLSAGDRGGVSPPALTTAARRGQAAMGTGSAGFSGLKWSLGKLGWGSMASGKANKANERAQAREAAETPGAASGSARTIWDDMMENEVRAQRAAADIAAETRLATGVAPAHALVSFLSGDDMLPEFESRFDMIRTSFAGMQYQIDHTSLCVKLVTKLVRGCKGRLLLDKGNFVSSSCKRQCARLLELADAGCEMRTVKPRGGGFACMHVKSWILDEEVVLTGSTNLTHNGLENNKEHLFVISESSAVSSVMSDFEREWEAADVVTPERLVAMKETWDKQYASGQRSRSASSSVVRGRSEPVLRSLTEELDAAGNE
jgi:hypothetical protein